VTTKGKVCDAAQKLIPFADVTIEDITPTTSKLTLNFTSMEISFVLTWSMRTNTNHNGFKFNDFKLVKIE
jgi:hypothetical protein